MVVDGRYVHRIDATVAKNLRLLHQDLEARHTKLIFWNWCDETRETLTRYESALSVHFCNSATLSQIFAGSGEFVAIIILLFRIADRNLYRKYKIYRRFK